MTDVIDANLRIDVAALYQDAMADTSLPIDEQVQRLSGAILAEYQRIMREDLPVYERVKQLSALTGAMHTTQNRAGVERAFAVLSILKVWMFSGRKFEQIDRDLRAKASRGEINAQEFDDQRAAAGRARDEERRGHPQPADVWLRLLNCPRNLMKNIADKAPRAEEWPDIPNAPDVALRTHQLALTLDKLRRQYVPVRDDLIRQMLNEEDWRNADVARLTGLETSHIAIIRGGRR